LNGAGVVITQAGEFIMNSGLITNNTATGTTSAGGVVVQGTTGSAVFTMVDGTISNNIAENTTSAGGVFVTGATAVFNMLGGTISGNRATNDTATVNAGGVRVNTAASIFNMRGGTISGNFAAGTAAGSDTVSAASGGVSILSGGIFRMSGGTIQGLDAGSALSNNAIAGTVSLARAAGTAQDVNIQYGTFAGDNFTGTGSLKNDDFTITVTAGTYTPPAQPDDTASLAARLAWHRIHGSGTTPLTFNVSEDENFYPGRAKLPARDITLIGTGAGERKIGLEVNGYLFDVGANTILTLQDITLVGRRAGVDGATVNNTHPVVNIGTGGTVNLNEGSKITGNTCAANTTTTATMPGGGVRLTGAAGNLATLNINGGFITGNIAMAAPTGTAASSTAGGIHIAANSVVNLNSGGVTDNECTLATSAGGVILGATPATFNMTGGTISGNKASNATSTASAAGGVRVGGGASYIFNMKGGTIHGNSASSSAATASGGVNVIASGIFRISDGIIMGNTADSENYPGLLPNTFAAGFASVWRGTVATGARHVLFNPGLYTVLRDNGDLVNSATASTGINSTIHIVDGYYVPTGVTVATSPAGEETVTKGTPLTFTAAVAPVNASQTVVWNVSPEGAGTFEGNVFTVSETIDAGDTVTITATATAGTIIKTSDPIVLTVED